MRLLTCLLLILANTPTRGDDPKPVSPVRAKLDAATVLNKLLLGDLIRDYEVMEAEHLADDAKVSRMKVVDDRMAEAITPSLDDLLAAASDHPNDPSSVEALGFVALNARGVSTDQSRRALVALTRDHVRASNISTVTRTLFVHFDKPEATALLRAVLADNPSRTERRRACNDLAWTLWFAATRIERSDQSPGQYPRQEGLRGVDPVALRREAEALYDRCAGEFADVPIIGYGAGKTVGDFARGALFDLRHLQVGHPAPEITGHDVYGQPLTLSDHLGKVVVLVFSGQWCGPCRRNAPFFRDLLKPEAQRTDPCVVLEVNTDAAREPLRQALDSGEITWPCWFDGGVTGPITLAWGVAEFPLIFVIDPQGVIRARNIDGQTTAAVVTRILAKHSRVSNP